MNPRGSAHTEADVRIVAVNRWRGTVTVEYDGKRVTLRPEDTLTVIADVRIGDDA